MATTKFATRLPEPESTEFIEDRLVHLEDLARKGLTDWLNTNNKLSEIEVRLARIEDLLRKALKT